MSLFPALNSHHRHGAVRIIPRVLVNVDDDQGQNHLSHGYLVEGSLALALDEMGRRNAVEGKGFRFHFPVVTCILLSPLLTGIMWLVRFFSK